MRLQSLDAMLFENDIDMPVDWCNKSTNLDAKYIKKLFSSSGK